MRRFAIAALAACLVALSATGEVVPLPELGTRLINLPTQLTVGVSTLSVVFTHRFSQTVDDGGGRNLFGLDSAADIGLGANLGLSPRFDVELYRSSFFKQWEGAVKWTVVRQGDAMPLGIGVRVGGAYRSASGVTERWTSFAQLVVARRVGESLDLFLVPMFASDTPSLRNAGNVGVAAALHLPRKWDVEAELIPANRDARDGRLAWALGIAKRIPGHEFLLYFGNSRATTADLLVGSDLPGGFKSGDVRLGFNLTRRFPE